MSIAKTEPRPISITTEFRFITDDRQYTLQSRHMTGPPVNPPADYVHTPREVWRDIGYYPLNNAGLRTMLVDVAHKTAAEAPVSAVDDYLAELDRIMRDFTAKLPAI